VIENAGGQGLLIDSNDISLALELGKNSEVQKGFDPVAYADGLGSKYVVLPRNKGFPGAVHGDSILVWILLV
jgi:hypothetical protein